MPTDDLQMALDDTIRWLRLKSPMTAPMMADDRADDRR